jgi:hypothetical protein
LRSSARRRRPGTYDHHRRLSGRKRARPVDRSTELTGARS